MRYCIYLRKSRKDIDCDEEEVLQRHLNTLQELAAKRGYVIDKIYREIVSGDTIAARPQMQQLLADVENNMWDGVLVKEIERLARGDSVDQGLVAQTFKYSNTLIITPDKIYDPSNEFDEEFFEIGLFMSRREYNTIKRRLNDGRMASTKEGKFIGSVTPYGYDKEKLVREKGYKLIINEDEAKYVRMMFELYSYGKDGKEYGALAIANLLNDLGVLSKKQSRWSPASIRDILKNPVYIGKLRNNYSPTKVKIVDGQKVTYRVHHSDNYNLYEGLHEAIIDEDTFNAVQQRFEENKQKRSHSNVATFQNPLAGLIVCKRCNHIMVRKKAKSQYGSASLVCNTPHCRMHSSLVSLVEKRVINMLKDLYEKYSVETNINQEINNDNDVFQKVLDKLEKQLVTLEKQLSNTYDYFEKEIYSLDEFVQRSETLKKRISETKDKITNMKEQMSRTKDYYDFCERTKKILEVYDECDIISEKNTLLKTVIEKIEYNKETRGKSRVPETWDEFELTIFPKI